jgi:hypothetical protein
MVARRPGGYVSLQGQVGGGAVAQHDRVGRQPARGAQLNRRLERGEAGIRITNS